MRLIGQLDLLRFPGAKLIEHQDEKGIFIPVSSSPTIRKTADGCIVGVVLRERRHPKGEYNHFMALSCMNPGPVIANFKRDFVPLVDVSSPSHPSLTPTEALSRRLDKH